MMISRASVDLDHLLLGDREVADHRHRINPQADPRGHLSGPIGQASPAHEHPTAGLAADEHVLGYGEVGQKVELLVDGRNAQRLGLVRRRERARSAAHLDAPGIRRLGSSEDLEQSRLAGAVLPEQAMDFAGKQLERDVLQRLHAGIALGDPRHAQQRLGHARRSTGPVRRRHRPFRSVSYFSSPSRSAWSKLSSVIAAGVSSMRSLSGFVPLRR
jgi:hypothetical protein